MHRTDASGHSSHTFTDGDAGTGTPATVIDDDWLNAVQAELIAPIEDAGVALVKGTNTQLASVLASLITPGGRLTLSPGVPVTTSDVTAGTSVYYSPHKGNKLPIYNGSRWVITTFTELAQTTADTVRSPAAVANNSNYDMFVWISNGVNRCTRGPAWSSDTSRGTGAGTTELELFEGRFVNKVAITNGPAARCGLYVGTVRSDGSAQINDSLAKRHVWNAYNRLPRVMRVTETTDSWTYNTAAFRQMNNSAANQLDIVRGLDEDAISVEVSVIVTNSAGAANAYSNIGLDSTTTAVSGFICGAVNTHVTGIASTVGAKWVGLPGLGRHYLAAIENGAASSGTQTWFGDNGAPGLTQSGIFGSVLG